jgi:phenylacetate-CoA ligase
MSNLSCVDTMPMENVMDLAQIAWGKQRNHVMLNSGFYRELWAGQDVPKNLLDLGELPLSDKAQLRISQEKHGPFGNYLATEREKIVRMHRTSGTTGQAMNLALSEKDCLITQIVGGRSHQTAGLTPSHTVVHCLNYQMWMGGLTDHMTLEATGALVIPYGVGGTERLIQTILDVGIDAISCTPSYPLVLERVIEDKFPHLKPADLGLKLGLFGGEPGLDGSAFRERIEKTWGMKARNANYGVSDVFSNFAAQCEHDTRLHFLAADVLFPELIDPDAENVVPIEPGAKGELVLTHLVRECQPLVRFRTGDVIEVDETSTCTCGRNGFRFRVVGRSDDMVVVRGLNMFPTMVGSILAAQTELSGDYRIVLENLPPYDVLPVTAELARGRESSPALIAKLEANLKRSLGASARIKLVPHGTFPVTEGKTRRVIRSTK